MTDTQTHEMETQLLPGMKVRFRSLMTLRDVRAETVLIFKMPAAILTRQRGLLLVMVGHKVLLHVAGVGSDLKANVALDPASLYFVSVTPHKRVQIISNWTSYIFDCTLYIFNVQLSRGGTWNTVLS